MTTASTQINELPIPMPSTTPVAGFDELYERNYGRLLVLNIVVAGVLASIAPLATIIQTAPRPDFFFLWLYALLSLLPPSLETPALLIGPVVVILGLILLPFLSGHEDPAQAAEGTVRKRFGLDKGRNSVHASDSETSAERDTILRDWNATAAYKRAGWWGETTVGEMVAQWAIERPDFIDQAPAPRPAQPVEGGLRRR